VSTNSRILNIKQGSEELVSTTVKLENSVIIQPCYIGKNVQLTNSVIGPNVSLEEGVMVEDSRITESIVQAHSIVKNARLHNSLLGKNVIYTDKSMEISLGDFSTQL
jgi:glucose-1-phosphate thymidylyltransferase